MQVFSTLSHLPVRNHEQSDKDGGQSLGDRSLPVRSKQAETGASAPRFVGAQLALNYFVPNNQNNKVREGLQQIRHHRQA